MTGHLGKVSNKVVVANNKPKEAAAAPAPAQSPALGMVATIIQNGRQVRHTTTLYAQLRY